MAVKEKALKRLAEKLNAAGVPWAVGDAWLCVHMGASQVYHEIDIFTDYANAAAADKVLTRLGMKSAAEDDGVSFRCHYHFDGADISLTAGSMAMTVGEETYHSVFDGESAAKTDVVLGAQVHLMPMEDWLVYYTLQGKEKNAAQVLAWLQTNGADKERFSRAVQEPLPESVLDVVNTL